MGRPKTGAIETLPDGRHRVRVTTHGKRVDLGTYDSRAEAELARRVAAEATRAEGVTVDVQTIATWGAAWLDRRELARTVRDVEGERSIWRTHLERDPIAKLALRRITRGTVLEWVDRLRAKGLAPQTVRNAIGVLRGMLGAALDSGEVRANHALGIRLPRERRTEEPWTWLQPNELRRLVAAVEGPERWLVLFAASTGLRAGELVSLRTADVHADHVVVRYGSEGDGTKSGKIRRVPLLGHAGEAWREWRAALGAWLARPHRRSTVARSLAFPGRRGAPRDPNHVLRWDVWKAALETAALGRSVRWHDLRHTCASSLVSGVWGRTWSLEEVRDVLGHSSITITQRYAHLAESAVKIAARNTPGTAEGFAPELPRAVSGESAKLPRLLGAPGRNRTCDLRFRKPLDLADLSRTWDPDGQIVGKTRAFVEAVAAGGDGRTALAELRAALVVALGRVLDRLSGPHAVAEGARLAEVLLAVGIETDVEEIFEAARTSPGGDA